MLTGPCRAISRSFVILVFSPQILLAHWNYSVSVGEKCLAQRGLMNGFAASLMVCWLVLYITLRLDGLLAYLLFFSSGVKLCLTWDLKKRTQHIYLICLVIWRAYKSKMLNANFGNFNGYIIQGSHDIVLCYYMSEYCCHWQCCWESTE